MARITVKGTGDDNKVVIWEKSPEHPNGEILVSNDGKAVEVGKTKGITDRLRDGRLVETEAEAPKNDAKKPSAKKPSSPAPTPAPVPWDGYADDTIDGILAELKDADADTLAKVVAYENANGKRTEILAAAQPK